MVFCTVQTSFTSWYFVLYKHHSHHFLLIFRTTKAVICVENVVYLKAFFEIFGIPLFHFYLFFLKFILHWLFCKLTFLSVIFLSSTRCTSNCCITFVYDSLIPNLFGMVIDDRFLI